MTIYLHFYMSNDYNDDYLLRGARVSTSRLLEPIYLLAHDVDSFQNDFVKHESISIIQRDTDLSFLSIYSVVVFVLSHEVGLIDSKFGRIYLMVDKAKATRTQRIVEEFVYCLFRGEKMMPVLHYFPPSPPCRAVLILGRMLNIEFDLRVVNIMEGDQLKPEFLEVSVQASPIEWEY